MSVYAPVPAFVDDRRHPRALLLIVAAHAALLAAVMTARPEMLPGFVPTITRIDLIDETKPPPENPPPPEPSQRPSSIDLPATVVRVPQPSHPSIDPMPAPTIDAGPIVDPNPPTRIAPPADPVRVGPRFATLESDVKPPYPQSKIRSEEEAVLRLRLTIDGRGRVTAVDALGSADPVFLAAARRHLIAPWRDTPATEDGRPGATSTLITLTFTLD